MKKEKFSIPVLMYHHVNPKGSSVNVTPQRFESHMRYLNNHGYTSIHAAELLDILTGTLNPPEKAIMITFDDGWLDNWVFAFPILKRFRMKALIFVITSLIPERGKRQRADEGNISSMPSHKECQKIIESGHASQVMISWEEIALMVKSGLIDIQSHTHTHRRHNNLYSDHTESIQFLKEELQISKQIIVEKVGKNCTALCWPWGKYSEYSIKTAQSVGYKIMFTTEKGTNTDKTDPSKIKRIVIGNISTISLHKKLFIHSRDWLSKAYLTVFKK